VLEKDVLGATSRRHGAGSIGGEANAHRMEARAAPPGLVARGAT
jgi:hypothetical protein